MRLPAPLRAGKLALRFSRGCGMNLAAVNIEHADQDRAGRPVNLGDKLNRANGVPGVGGEFANDVRPPVEKLDSVLHAPIRDVPMLSVRSTTPNWPQA